MGDGKNQNLMKDYIEDESGMMGDKEEGVINNINAQINWSTVSFQIDFGES